jgi:tight adherence protein B
MTGTTWAAVLLAVATLIRPDSARRRLIRQRRSFPRRASLMAGVSAAVVMLSCAPPATAAAIAVAALTVASRRRRRNIRRLSVDENRSLAMALEVLVGELRIGAHPVSAFEVAADEASGMVKSVLSGVAARARLGGDVAAGLRAAGSRPALGAQWHRLAACWQIAADHGLPIAALVRAAQTDIVERQRFSERVDSSMAGARATASILATLPVIGVFLGELIGAAPLAYLTGGGIGGGLLAAGTGLLCLGVVWAGHITDRVQP